MSLTSKKILQLITLLFVIIIRHAERFGLSALHQLRVRVGRDVG